MALTALIIAIGSLVWTVISTLYSWKFSKPSIEITAMPWFSRDEDYLEVEVRNKGGSAVGITGIMVWYEFATWRQRYYRPQRKRWLRRIVDGSALHPISDTAGKNSRYFLVTIEAYHSAKWQFDRPRLLKRWLKSSNHPNKLRIDVQLATGKTVRRYIDIQTHLGNVQADLDFREHLAVRESRSNRNFHSTRIARLLMRTHEAIAVPENSRCARFWLVLNERLDLSLVVFAYTAGGGIMGAAATQYVTHVRDRRTARALVCAR